MQADWTTGEELQMQPRVHLRQYQFRVIVGMNDVLFDPHVGNWVETDGRVPVCDVGGQPRHLGFDPELGHGAIWWLTSDNRLEPAVPWGHTQLGMPMFPRLAPASFGRWAGHALVLSQVHPGRRGAHRDHVIHLWDRRSDQLILFAVLPRNDSAAGGGIPAALIPGAFGPNGTPHEGNYYAASLGNKTIYRVRGDGQADSFAILDGRFGPALLPRALCFGGQDTFPQYNGKLIVGGVPQVNFSIGDRNTGRQVGQQVQFHIVEEGVVQPEPICTGNRMLALGVRAGAFGPLSGRMLYSDHGAINQSQSIYDNSPLPHDGAILYADEGGAPQPLVTGLRGGRNELFFDGRRLLISHWGKSYSTGEFHHPDGALWELHHVG
jgi:hypothetical protein